jgi:hypothetical protein
LFAAHRAVRFAKKILLLEDLELSRFSVEELAGKQRARAEEQIDNGC